MSFINRIQDKTNKWWKFTLLIFLIIVTFTYAMFQGGFVSWFLFYGFLPFALYALIVFVYPLSDIAVERMIKNQELTEGESVKIRIIMERKIPIPIVYILVNELLPNKLSVLLGREKVSSIIFPGFSRKKEWSYTLKGLPRGEHIFSNLEIRTGDILGLIEKKHLFTSNQRVLVLPLTVPLPLRQIFREYEHGRRSNSYKIRNETAMVSGIRDYAPGDRMTVIDWKSSAKGVGLKTKNFEEKHSGDVLLLINCESELVIFEEMVTFSASITESGLRKGMRIGLWAGCDDGADNLLEIKGGKEHIQRVLTFMAKISASKRTDLNSVRSYAPQKRVIPPHASLIVITSILDLSFVKSYVRLSGDSHSLFILFFCHPTYTLNKFEKEAYTFGVNHGAKLFVIRSRADWKVFEDRGSR